MKIEAAREERILFENVSIADLSVHLLKKATIKVLVVVDGSVSHSDTGGFGVGRFVRLLRDTTLGCTRFEVDVARRDGATFADNGSGGAGHLRYSGFRFHSEVGGARVLERYDEAFLFGFEPGNDGSSNDANIVEVNGTERAAMLDWMDAGGGVFATGDHHYLGADLCAGIPRVRSMRRWTNADGVPPIGGNTRLDTNQPDTPAEEAGTAMILNTAERDATPQPITWIPEASYTVGLFRYSRPHEILCHPVHGPIDVMPDHPHEGMCFTRTEVDADPAKRADFPGGELPKIIATGEVVPDPPTWHQKGDVDARTIRMISAYDGWKENVGRVVVDSTWHHWFNLNLDGIEAAGGADWDKISRYFVNVAKWIAPPGKYRDRCWWEILASHYAYPGIEEYHRAAGVLEIGNALRETLVRIHGPCTVRSLTILTICEIAPEVCRGLVERFEIPRPNPCLSCPPIDLIELAVLGGMVEGTRDLAAKVASSVRGGKGVEISLDDVRRAAMAGAERSLAEIGAQIAESAQGVAKLFAEVGQARSRS